MLKTGMYLTLKKRMVVGFEIIMINGIFFS